MIVSTGVPCARPLCLRLDANYSLAVSDTYTGLHVHAHAAERGRRVRARHGRADGAHPRDDPPPRPRGNTRRSVPAALGAVARFSVVRALRSATQAHCGFNILGRQPSGAGNLRRCFRLPSKCSPLGWPNVSCEGCPLVSAAHIHIRRQTHKRTGSGPLVVDRENGTTKAKECEGGALNRYGLKSAESG